MNGSPNIQAVLFDMGGTLEHIYYDRDLRLKATADMADLLARHDGHASLPILQLYACIESGLGKYRIQQARANRELPPERVWADYILAETGIPRDKIVAVADELSDFFEVRFLRREMRREAPEVLEALRGQGLAIGMVSNTISRHQVPALLTRYGILDYFNPIVLSVVFGWRKPDPRIFLHAASLMGVQPRNCAYVGDTISRDVLGARRAGFGLVIRIPSFLSSQVDKGDEGVQPDAEITDLREVLALLRRDNFA